MEKTKTFVCYNSTSLPTQPLLNQLYSFVGIHDDSLLLSELLRTNTEENEILNQMRANQTKYILYQIFSILSVEDVVESTYFL